MPEDRPSPEPAEQIQAANLEAVNREASEDTRRVAERARATNHDSASQGLDSASPSAPREDR